MDLCARFAFVYDCLCKAMCILLVYSIIFQALWLSSWYIDFWCTVTYGIYSPIKKTVHGYLFYVIISYLLSQS